MTMKEINRVEFFYEKLNLIISYDCTVISEKKVVNWIKSIIEIILDNYEEVKSFAENKNKEGLMSFILPELKKEINLNKYKVN